MNMKSIIMVWTWLVVVLLTAGCQTTATKPQKYDDRSLSYLTYGLKLHAQGRQRAEPEWIGERQFIERIGAVYEEKTGKPMKDDGSFSRSTALQGIIDNLYGHADGSCNQFDAELKDSNLHVFIECSIGDGFIFYEYLFSYQQGDLKIIDLRVLSAGAWYSEVLASILVDSSGLAKVSESYDFIKSVKAGHVDYATYYSINAYIKQSKVLTLSLNSVLSDKHIRKELGQSLEQQCPEDPFCAVGLIDYYVESKQYDALIKSLLTAKQHYPRSLNINSLLANVYIEVSDPNNALQTAKDVIWVHPSSHEGYMLVLSSAAMLDDMEQASMAAATLMTAFKLSKQQITNEFNQTMLSKPEFWDQVAKHQASYKKAS